MLCEDKYLTIAVLNKNEVVDYNDYTYEFLI